MNTTNIFKHKKIIPEKLLKYGFEREKNVYSYRTVLPNGEFELYVEINSDNKAKTELREISTGEIYTLHLLSDAEGNFVGKIREEYDNILEDIKQKCFETGIFEWDYTYRIINYCKEKYGDKEEYLWAKTPRNAIIRRKDNQKWYLALLSVNGDKLGQKTDEIIEIINLMVRADEMQDILKNKNIYPAYHMNKKHWISIILDGSVPVEDIFQRIDTSYELAHKK